MSWVVFDIGQSLFYFAVVGLFFPLWVTRHLGGDDATVGFTMATGLIFVQSGDYAVGFRIIVVIFILTSLPLFLFLKETPSARRVCRR